MKNRSVSVTGATGFLGSHVALELFARGWNVRAIVRRGNTKPMPEGVEVEETNLDRAPLAAAMLGSDVVVHAAGLTRGRGDRPFRSVNVDGTRAVVAAANDIGARIVHISSLAAIGPGTPDQPAQEEDRPQPLTSYGRSKLASEAVVRSEAHVPWTILRPSAVYGPNDRQFLPLVRLAARGIFPLLARPSTAFTLAYVGDVARAVAMAADDERCAGEALFIGHPDPQTAYAILRQLAHAVERPFKPVRLPGVLVRALALAGESTWSLGARPVFDLARFAELRADGFVCSVDRARSLLGFTAEISLAEGLDQTVRWYRARGWI
jgi:nucleoside-diphosphate-sugar epimerase